MADIPKDIFDAAYDAASIATDVGDLPMVVAAAVYPRIAAYVLRQAADAMPTRNGTAQTDLWWWLHDLADKHERFVITAPAQAPIDE